MGGCQTLLDVACLEKSQASAGLGKVLWLHERTAAPTEPLFPNARGGVLSRDGIEYLVAKHVRAASTSTISMPRSRTSVTYLIVPSPEALVVAGRRVLIYESADGQVEIRCAGQLLPYTVLDKQPLLVVSGGASALTYIFL